MNQENGNKQVLHKIKKTIFLFLISILSLFGILSYELNAAVNVVSTKIERNFLVLDHSLDSIYITYDLGQQPTQFQNTFVAPKIIQTQDTPGTFRALNSSYIALGEETQINTLVFTRNKFHFALMSGELILDNTTEQSTITLQVGNALINPYNNGVFYVAKKDNLIEVHVIQGNAEVGIYNRDGSIARQILLSRDNRITSFDAFPAEGDFEIEQQVATNLFFNQINELSKLPTLYDQIVNQNIFALTYKGQLVEPTQSRFLSAISNFSFNQKRIDYFAIANFYAELNGILALAENQPVSTEQINRLRAIYATDIALNPAAINALRENLTSKSNLILAIRPNNNLYELRLYLQTFFREVPASEIIIASLEDLYLLYPEDRSATIIRIFENLKEVIPSVGVQDSLKLISILDNLAETTIKANTKELFEARNLLSQKINTTIDRTQFRTKSRQHLTRLQLAYRLNQLPTSSLRTATEELLLSLDPASQVDYQSFLLELR